MLENDSGIKSKLRAVAATPGGTQVPRPHPVTLKAAKDAFRRVIDMSYDNAEDYLVVRQEAANILDPTEGRKEGIRQFIDEKSYKPGLANYRR